MNANKSEPSTLHRARRASSSRSQDCLPSAPTTRPIDVCPHELGYVWKGSAETRNMNQETVKLDVYLLPSTGGNLYLVEVRKPAQTSLANANRHHF